MKMETGPLASLFLWWEMWVLTESHLSHSTLPHKKEKHTAQREHVNSTRRHEDTQTHDTGGVKHRVLPTRPMCCPIMSSEQSYFFLNNKTFYHVNEKSITSLKIFRYLSWKKNLMAIFFIIQISLKHLFRLCTEHITGFGAIISWPWPLSHIVYLLHSEWKRFRMNILSQGPNGFGTVVLQAVHSAWKRFSTMFHLSLELQKFPLRTLHP